MTASVPATVAKKFDVEHPLDRLVVAAGHRQHQVDSGIVDQDVDRPLRGGRLFEGVPEGARPTHVADRGRAARRAARQFGRELVEQFFAPGQPDDDRAPLGQGQGDRLADARGGTGDHGDSAFEALRWTVARHADTLRSMVSCRGLVQRRRGGASPTARLRVVRRSSGPGGAPSARRSTRPAGR